MILIDTGPLVAMLNRKDQFHVWTREQMDNMKPPLHTCESVISETCFRLSQAHLDTSAIFNLIDRRIIVLSFDLQIEHQAVAKLMKKYSNLPMDLADACLVRMAEQNDKATVLTLDGDFLIYRKRSRQIIPTLLPDEIRSMMSRNTKTQKR